MNKIAVKKIEDAQRIHATVLNLSSLDLEKIPKEILALKELTSLDLSDNQIKNIVILSQLKELNKLSLASNKIKNISVLSKLTKLRELNLFNNRINDITPLLKLYHLNRLYLGANSLKNIRALEEKTCLTYLDIGKNNKIYRIWFKKNALWCVLICLSMAVWIIFDLNYVVTFDIYHHREIHHR